MSRRPFTRALRLSVLAERDLLRFLLHAAVFGKGVLVRHERGDLAQVDGVSNAKISGLAAAVIALALMKRASELCMCAR